MSHSKLTKALMQDQIHKAYHEYNRQENMRKMDELIKDIEERHARIKELTSDVIQKVEEQLAEVKKNT